METAQWFLLRSNGKKTKNKNGAMITLPSLLLMILMMSLGWICAIIKL
jgi:hypothetical protein